MTIVHSSVFGVVTMPHGGFHVILNLLFAYIQARINHHCSCLNTLFSSYCAPLLHSYSVLHVPATQSPIPMTHRAPHPLTQDPTSPPTSRCTPASGSLVITPTSPGPNHSPPNPSPGQALEAQLEMQQPVTTQQLDTTQQASATHLHDTQQA